MTASMSSENATPSNVVPLPSILSGTKRYVSPERDLTDEDVILAALNASHTDAIHLVETVQSVADTAVGRGLYDPQRAANWLVVCWRNDTRRYLLSPACRMLRGIPESAPVEERIEIAEDWLRSERIHDLFYYMCLTTAVRIRQGKASSLNMRVMARDHFICAYCGGFANTVDHVYPRSRGGNATSMRNLVAACSTCNAAKGALRVTDAPVQPLWLGYRPRYPSFRDLKGGLSIKDAPIDSFDEATPEQLRRHLGLNGDRDANFSFWITEHGRAFIATWAHSSVQLIRRALMSNGHGCAAVSKTLTEVVFSEHPVINGHSSYLSTIANGAW